MTMSQKLVVLQALIITRRTARVRRRLEREIAATASPADRREMLRRIVPRLTDSRTVARINPGLLAYLLSGPICADVVAGLPDTRLLLAADRPNTNHPGGRRPPAHPAEP
jgi:hypothetical protein